MSETGACILSCDGPRLSADEKALFAEAQPFGFILFARHVETPDQVRGLCDALRSAVGRDCFITIDQEGGRVQRLRGGPWRDWHPPMDQIETAGAGAARSMYLRARLIADELRALGLDSNCLPTLDVSVPQTHPFLRNRCYGEEPEQVIACGRATANGLLEGGVVPIMKHMPGHGRAQQDTHFDLPRVTEDLDLLDATDFAPFRALSDLPMGMTGHLVFDALDPASPSTLSKPVIEAIRTRIGFDGLLMTDDISMKALSGDLAARSRASIAAGCDVVLHCNDTFAERVAVSEAAGRMGADAQRRADAALQTRRTPDPIDIPALEAELKALLSGQVYV